MTDDPFTTPGHVIPRGRAAAGAERGNPSLPDGAKTGGRRRGRTAPCDDRERTLRGRRHV
jgi:hypothetical protein